MFPKLMINSSQKASAELTGFAASLSFVLLLWPVLPPLSAAQRMRKTKRMTEEMKTLNTLGKLIPESLHILLHSPTFLPLLCGNLWLAYRRCRPNTN